MKKNIIKILLSILLMHVSLLESIELDESKVEEIQRALTLDKQISFEKVKVWSDYVFNISREERMSYLYNLFDSKVVISEKDALFYSLINSEGNSEKLYSNLVTWQKYPQVIIEQINTCKKIHEKYPNLTAGQVEAKFMSDIVHAGVRKAAMIAGSAYLLICTIQATQPIWAPFVQNIIRKFMFKNSIQPAKTSVLFSQIYGYEDIKKRLRIIVKGLKKQKKSQKMEKIDGVLFYGDPGCGKTYVVQAIAHEADVPFFAIKVSDLLNDKGVVEDRIRLLFNKISGYILNYKVPVILFIDELDLLIPTRAQGKLSPEERLILQDFLSLLDGQIPLEGVLLIGNTNYIKDIDVALLRRGRIGTHIEFTLPTEEDIVILIMNFAKEFGVSIDEVFDMKSFAALFNGKNVSTIKSSIALLKDYMIENNKKLIFTNELLASYLATFALY